MNYRHAYHAGNFADVMKHLILVACIEHLKRKSTAFRVIDTHAGRGTYALDADESAMTEEWKAGIASVLAAAPNAPTAVAAILTPYLDQVRRDIGAAGALSAYPGSPAFVSALLRPGDHLVANELHPEDHQYLAAHFATDRRVKVMNMDAWTALRALLPPPERRGLVLIDPPFEQPGEFHRMIEGLDQSLSRFRTGIYLLWYPVKDPKPVERFLRGVSQMTEAYEIETVLNCQLMLRSPRHPDRLNGCGVVVVNPPYGLAAHLEPLLGWLADSLGDPSQGRGTVETLPT